MPEGSSELFSDSGSSMAPCHKELFHVIGFETGKPLFSWADQAKTNRYVFRIEEVHVMSFAPILVGRLGVPSIRELVKTEPLGKIV